MSWVDAGSNEQSPSKFLDSGLYDNFTSQLSFVEAFYIKAIRPKINESSNLSRVDIF